MKQFHFKISEFVITGAEIPVVIADKLLHYHMIPMNFVREKLGVWISASENSGYRPYKWEIARGRSGNSQHTFGERANGIIDPVSLGAVDWTCKDFQKNKDELLDLIISETNYTRIAIYGTFIHCDFKARDGKRYLFKSGPDSKWKFIKHVS